jgi:hypothetical protein
VLVEQSRLDRVEIATAQAVGALAADALGDGGLLCDDQARLRRRIGVAVG